MKEFLKNLFKSWQPDPELEVGDIVIVKSKEFESYIKKPFMSCTILQRDKMTSKHYYKVVTSDYLDHNNEPLEFYVHEENII